VISLTEADPGVEVFQSMTNDFPHQRAGLSTRQLVGFVSYFLLKG